MTLKNLDHDLILRVYLIELNFSLDRISQSDRIERGVENLAMSSDNLDDTDIGSGCLHMIDPLSPDSEYGKLN